MSRLSHIVEEALRDYPETRSSDRALIVKVWELETGQLMHQKLKEFFLHDASFPDSITRARRKFQEHGEYLATPKVDEERFNKFKQMRDVTPRVTSPHQMELI